MISLKKKRERSCSICERTHVPMSLHQDGFVCEDCSEATREGRDNTSRALKSLRTASRLEVDQRQLVISDHNPEVEDYSISAERLMAQDSIRMGNKVLLGSGGEPVNPKAGGLINTLTDPSIAALEASSHRTDLLTMLGNDIAALALDTADTVQASNSMEKMLAHQLAAIHHASMKLVHRANLIQDPVNAARLMNAAMRGFSAFQGGINSLQQLRGSQEQRILVQHVNVGAGGQAVVGNVSNGGGAS